MNNSELNTEQIIIEAAEAEFLEKGYGNTKMMAIAKRANVAHSMLHYYFRSKENLFQKVFVEKAQSILPFFENVFQQRLPFFDTVRLLLETQFNFLKQNPKLPLFLLTEILANKENRTLLFDVLSKKAINLLSKLKGMLEEEVQKGTVRPIQFQDLMMNIVSINTATFVSMPILQDITGANDEAIESMLAARCESNIQFILAALRP